MLLNWVLLLTMPLTDVHLAALSAIRNHPTPSPELFAQVNSLYHTWPLNEIPFPQDVEILGLTSILKHIHPYDGNAARRLIQLLEIEGSPVSDELKAKSGFYGPPPTREADYRLRSFAFLRVFKTGGTSLSDWIVSQTQNQLTFVPSDPHHFSLAGRALSLEKAHCIRGHFYLPDTLKSIRDGRLFSRSSASQNPGC